jgi:hypothetical protein
MPDRLAPFDSDDPKCPKCGLPLRRVAANAGSFFLTCDNKIPQQGRFPERCGQTVHVIAFEGVAIVTPVSKADFQIFRRSYPQAGQVYKKLGILPSRPNDSPAAIPEFSCLDCGTRTPLYQLREGVCPKCVSKTAIEA